MKLKEDNIDIYNNSAIILKNKTSPLINSWIVILIILSLIFIIISFIPFNIYKSYNGYVVIKNNKSYISLIVNDDFPINKNNKLYIKKDKYKYEVISIEKNNILIDLDLNSGIKINNNYVVVNILKDRVTIFEILKRKIKKGFDL